jgi:hypothetical protein
MARQARQKDLKRAKLARKIKERAEAKKQGVADNGEWKGDTFDDSSGSSRRGRGGRAGGKPGGRGKGRAARKGR